MKSKNKILDAVMGLCVADALGVPVEFMHSERTPPPLNYLTRLTESEDGGMNLMCFFKENISPLNA